jgi:phosphoglycolate phosphatase-like HAD superfamily hydrolase
LLERGLAHHKLEHFFSKVIAGDSGPHTKPNKLMLEHLLKKATPNYQYEVLMVGDSKYDLDLAKNCGIDFYFYSGGYNDLKSVVGIKNFSKYQEFDYSLI